MDEIRVAIIGLDTSHSVEFARRMQAPDCPPDQRVGGLRATACMRFETPFQDAKGLDSRQTQMESWKIPVTDNFDRAVADCDAVMIEINDAALHLEYFTRALALKKRVFLDKPLADTIENGRAIVRAARDAAVPFFSASSLRFPRALEDASERIPAPAAATVFGPLGKAPAGSSIVWYGVHSFEMLQRAMGRGAVRLQARPDGMGAVVVVDYAGDRRDIVELSGLWTYGGCLRSKDAVAPFVVDAGRIYTDLLSRIAAFFRGGSAPVSPEETLEIMAMLDAAERSHSGGGTVEDVQAGI